jgi:hypothetical protein
MVWKLVSAVLPIGLTVVGLLPLSAVVHAWRLRERRYTRESPLTHNMLRPPGHSLRGRIEQVNDEIQIYFLATVMIPTIAFAAHVSLSHFGGEPEGAIRVALTVLLASVASAYCGSCLLKELGKRKILVLGLEGELATAEELNQLMLDGCRVFHDIPFQYGNIDHVVVSHSGVYSVNTKMRGKPKETNGKMEVTVDHEQNIVRFPDGEYRIPTDQLEAETTWLSTFLTSAVGQQIKVESILAFPGWFIKERIGRGAAYVINPRKPKLFFVQNRQVLDQELMQRVAHQLEQLCRDVRPSYRTSKQWREIRE